MFLIIFILTALFALHSDNPSDLRAGGMYDLYFGGVKKGYSRYTVTPNGALTLEGETGTGAASKGTITFASGQTRNVDFEVSGPNAIRLSYEIHAGELMRKSHDGEQKSDMPHGGSFYYTLHPILLKYLLDRYSIASGGFQDLPAIDLITGKPRNVSAELNRTEIKRIGDRDVRIRLWRLETPPNYEAIVFTDETNYPLYWRVPGQFFEMVLQGYETLRSSYPFEGKVSPPVYKVTIERNVWIPMRDGVRLQADVFRPEAEGQFPVLLQRTPYERTEFGTFDGEFFSQRGYVYVTQHVRGRGGSEGLFEYCRHEDEDGYDTLQWCGTQPWSNGRVGMLGASYNAYSEWMTAKLKPKWLKTMISMVPMPGPPDGAPWDRGTYFPGDTLSWFGLLRDKERVQPFNVDLTAALNTLPLDQADKVVFGKQIPSYAAWFRPTFDDFVRKGSYRYDMNKIDLPVLHVSGWFDSVGIGTRLNYMQIVANGRKHQKLIWGPWNHFANRESLIGEFDAGPDAYIDLHMLFLRWFDRWLKNVRNGVDREAPVSTFMLNENRWYDDNAWPPKEAHLQKWYLHVSDSSGAKDDHGALDLTAPGQEPPTKYVYDPAKFVYGPELQASYFFSRAYDVSDLCKRKDQLVFDTEPFKQPLRLNGPVSGKLYASTSAVDTDWVMALLDVGPDGKAVSLCSGFVRAQYRDSYEHPTLLETNRTVAYDIDMWQIGIAIPAGHRLRVVVASTLFPDKDKNLNTGDAAGTGIRSVAAKQTIYHDAGHASFIALPVLPATWHRADVLKSTG